MGQTISYILQCMHIKDQPLGIPEICTLESEKDFETCKKKEQHKEYISVNEFTRNDLKKQAKKLWNEDMFQLVNTISNLTVKITSPKKMEQTEAKTSQGLEGYLNQYGSGRIAGIQKATEKDAIRCRCSKCKKNKINSTDLWVVLVFTATHVVPDTASAKQTTCTLFYDSEGTNEDMLDKIYGTSVHWNHKKGDLCLLYCVTCNSDLVNKLQNIFKKFNTAWKHCRSRADNLDCRKLLSPNCPIVIVSHPHGLPKKISFGKIEELHPAQPETKELQLKREYRLKYKACTCPGSSGAPVYVFGINYFKIEFVHSGASENLNFSTKWYLENRDLVDEYLHDDVDVTSTVVNG